MDIESLLIKYYQNIIDKNLELDEFYYPLMMGRFSFRIYTNKKDFLDQNINFVAHSSEEFSSKIILVFQDIHIFITPYSINIDGISDDVSADDYFNLLISKNLTVSFKTLKELQTLALLKKIRAVFYIDDIHEQISEITKIN